MVKACIITWRGLCLAISKRSIHDLDTPTAHLVLVGFNRIYLEHTLLLQQDPESYTELGDSELSHTFTTSDQTKTTSAATLFVRTEAKLSHVCLNLFLREHG